MLSGPVSDAAARDREPRITDAAIILVLAKQP
jgi:hypothetical protein